MICAISYYDTFPKSVMLYNDRFTNFVNMFLVEINNFHEVPRYSGHELDDIRVEGRVVACYHRV